jgi:7-cyano-7-deazaguanine synthase
VIRRGIELGVDYDTTYSCLLGYPVHCGRCPQCLKRRDAFRAAGLEEPVGFYRA